MNKYQKNTQRKKEAIVHAASEFFQNDGFIAVSIKEIAAAAQVSPVSIYNYFGSKERLVAECLPIIMESILEEARFILEEKDLPFHQKLERALALCNQETNQAISQYFTQKALADQQLTALLAKYLDKSKRDIYRAYIERGKKESVIDETLPTELVLDFMESLNRLGSKYTDQEHIRRLHELFLYGLLGEKHP